MTVLLPDVNIVVASMRADHPHHRPAVDFLVDAQAAGATFTTPVEVLASAMRVLMSTAWVEPETSASAAGLVRQWIAASATELVGHPSGALAIHLEFARTLTLTPRQVPDSLLAATAIALRATLVTFDRGLDRYPGLSSVILSAGREERQPPE